jgi:hypothetical protein
MPIFPKPDIKVKTLEEAAFELSHFYKEKVQFEGLATPLKKCCRLVAQGGIMGVVYTFRGGDGGLYAIPLPNEVAKAFCDEVEVSDISDLPAFKKKATA